MKGILYFPEIGEMADQIQKLIEARIPGEKFEVYHSIDGLSQRFKQPLYDLEVAVLIATNHEELINIFAIRHLLRNLGIILIIPDREEETIALAHRLRPRFLTYMNGDLSMVPTVLSKMFEAK